VTLKSPARGTYLDGGPNRSAQARLDLIPLPGFP
jgi:hypothetical protein